MKYPSIAESNLLKIHDLSIREVMSKNQNGTYCGVDVKPLDDCAERFISIIVQKVKAETEAVYGLRNWVKNITNDNRYGLIVFTT